MGTVTIVRHAQASFLDEDYDRLSPLGERQASALGAYWARTRLRLDHIFSGPRKRHLRTAEIAADAYRRAGLSWPEPVVLPQLDEYKADEVIRRYVPSLIENHPRIRALSHELVRITGTPQAANAAELLFRAVTTMWVRQEFDCGAVENWEEFCKRVKTVLDQVLELDNGAKCANVVVFSSAGPTAVGMQKALNLAPVATLELSWLVRNCSSSEFLFSGERFSLLSFNTVPHLEEPAMVTFR
jgi:broad specificity phosphatase PhoE